VASAVKCEKFFPESVKEGPVFRMHAVILTRKPESDKASGAAKLTKEERFGRNVAVSNDKSNIYLQIDSSFTNINIGLSVHSGSINTPLEFGSLEERKHVKKEQESNQSEGGLSGIAKWVPACNASNYILCHVRRVSGKMGDDDDEGGNETPVLLNSQDRKSSKPSIISSS
jgi:hypothetical protein